MLLGQQASLHTPKKRSLAHLDPATVLGFCRPKDTKDDIIIQVPTTNEQNQPDEMLRIPMAVIQHEQDLAILITVLMALALRNDMILRRGAKAYKTDPVAAVCPKLGTVGSGTTTMILAANLAGGIGC